jgi:hypothetical protein
LPGALVLVWTYCEVASLPVDDEIRFLEKGAAQHIEIVGWSLMDGELASAGVVERLADFQIEGGVRQHDVCCFAGGFIRCHCEGELR